MSQTYADYLREECGNRPRTIATREQDLRLIGVWLWSNLKLTLEGAEYDHFIAWIQAATRQGLSSNTIGRRIDSLMSWLRWRGRENIANRLEKPKRGHAVRRIPNVSEVNRLIESASTALDRAVLELLYGTGIRNEELRTLTVADLGGEMLKVNGKGGKVRYVPVNSKARQAVAVYLATRPGVKPTDPMFVGVKTGRAIGPDAVYDMVGRAAKRSHQRVHVFPHLLRHAFASHMVQAKVPIPIVKEYLGHSNMDTTALYLHYDVSEAKAMLKLCLPRERMAQGLPAERPVSEFIQRKSA